MFFVDHKRNFQCEKCSKRYLSKTALNRHIRYDCGKEPKFKCSMCMYTAYQKIHLIKHQNAIHKIIALEKWDTTTSVFNEVFKEHM